MSNPEAEIVAQLSASLERLEKTDDAPSSSQNLASLDEPMQPGDPYEPLRAKAELMEFFNIPAWARTSTEVDTKISAIMEWAQAEAGQYAMFEGRQTEMADVLRSINDRLRMMGATRDEDKLNRLWLFAKIHSQRRTLDQREEALYG